jgi:membrane-anchored mycosin MYCP
MRSERGGPARTAPPGRSAGPARAAAGRWRALAAGVLAAVGLAPALAAPAPARAVTATPGATGRAAQSVQSLEWWFSAWDIRSKVWPLTRGAGVTVAVLDSGVQANLPDIRVAVLPGGDTTGAGTNGMTDDDGSQGHGTGMAALIAGQGVAGGVLGIAPAAKILPVRVGGLGRAVAGPTPATVAAGIRYAVAHGAQVINMSLAIPAPSATSCDPVLQDAVADALQHNVVVVAGAGNANESGDPPEEPASCAGVLAVGAVAPSLKLWPDSERQPYVTVSAPGSDIADLAADGGNVFGNGTSSASAFTSGEAALVRSRHPSMPWYQVVQRIINTALPRGSPVPSEGYGFGIIRIPGAVNTSRYKVASSAPNPVYQAYRQWLASPQGTQFTSAGPPRAARSSPAAAPASSGGGAGLAAAVAAVVVVAGTSALVVVTARRRRRRRA